MIGLTTQAGMFGGGLLAETLAFQTLSGATDVEGIDAIGKYLKNQGLWSTSVLYPEKSAQNAGSGSTVYPYGGLTSNNRTLINSPSWTANGIDYVSSSSHYSTISDFLADESLMVFSRVALDDVTPSSEQFILGQYDSAANQRSWIVTNNNVFDVRLLRSEDGTATDEIWRPTTQTLTTSDTTIVSSYPDGGSLALWYDKTSKPLTNILGSATSRHNSTANIESMGASSGFHCDGLKVCDFFTTTELTTGQRESLTDLINAL